ncbi:hypothetical protein ACAN107058_18920 [Paracidovorax anthurii]|uniref:Uncharacterized protein n=2 Tax=Paracidovorax anthurii TaxID=78229 RepID=A0A328YGK6_9BURK|nr:hypothetical protein AX018_10837 [Paracidovorax anthurii]
MVAPGHEGARRPVAFRMMGFLLLAALSLIACVVFLYRKTRDGGPWTADDYGVAFVLLAGPVLAWLLAG